NVVRIYTLHPPAFYEALEEHNRQSNQPLYLIHGVWINEDKLAANSDIIAEENSTDFIREIHKTIDVIHGNITIPAEPGHASGVYAANISKYVLGYMIGVEWDPHVVTTTNEKHKGAA